MSSKIINWCTVNVEEDFSMSKKQCRDLVKNYLQVRKFNEINLGGMDNDEYWKNIFPILGEIYQELGKFYIKTSKCRFDNNSKTFTKHEVRLYSIVFDKLVYLLSDYKNLNDRHIDDIENIVGIEELDLALKLAVLGCYPDTRDTLTNKKLIYQQLTELIYFCIYKLTFPTFGNKKDGIDKYDETKLLNVIFNGLISKWNQALK